MASNQVVLWSSWGTNDEGNHTVESVKAALLAMRWKQPEQLASGMRTVSINSRTLVQLGSHRMPWGTGDGRPVQLPGQAATPVDLTKPPSTRRRCQFAIEEDDAKSLNFWQCVNGAIVEIAHDNSTQWFMKRNIKKSTIEGALYEFCGEPPIDTRTGEPKYSGRRVSIKDQWRPRYGPGEPSFRYAGVIDGDGALEMVNAVYMGREIVPDEVARWETHYYIQCADDSPPTDKVPVLDPRTGKPQTCERTGRIIYRYLGPQDCRRGYTATRTIIEFNSLWFNPSAFGMTLIALHKIVRPLEHATVTGFVDAAGATVAPIGGKIDTLRALASAQRMAAADVEMRDESDTTGEAAAGAGAGIDIGDVPE